VIKPFIQMISLILFRMLLQLLSSHASLSFSLEILRILENHTFVYHNKTRLNISFSHFGSQEFSRQIVTQTIDREYLMDLQDLILF